MEKREDQVYFFLEDLLFWLKAHHYAYHQHNIHFPLYLPSISLLLTFFVSVVVWFVILLGSSFSSSLFSRLLSHFTYLFWYMNSDALLNAV